MKVEDYIELKDEIEQRIQEDQYQIRQKMLNEIDELRNHRNIELPPLLQEEANAVEDHAAKELVYKLACDRKRDATNAVLKLKSAFNHQIQALSRKLENTAPNQIDEIISELKDEISSIRNSSAIQANTDWGNIQIRIDALSAAIEQAEALKMKAIPNKELDELLNLIREEALNNK